MILNGCALEELEFFPDNHFDAIVTDPPYGLAFMGKKWDYDVPSVDLWKEALRVLKPGGYLLSFGGTRTYHRMVVNIEDAGFEIRDQIMWLYGSGFPKSHNLKDEWQGWGTALKPANEPIVLARKPLSEKTVAANVLRWGTGGLNIDAGRIGYESEGDLAVVQAAIKRMQKSNNQNGVDKGAFQASKQLVPNDPSKGRWPANLILDEEAAAALDEQSGVSKSPSKPIKRKNTWGTKGIYGTADNTPTAEYGDSGGASRFFYVAKASKSERNAGLEGMPEKQNFHPTVKPVKLMEYLIKLVTPPQGIVLDPFCGSGTTGVAAKNLGFKFIGIEREKEYAQIAIKRISK